MCLCELSYFVVDIDGDSCGRTTALSGEELSTPCVVKKNNACGAPTGSGGGRPKMTDCHFLSNLWRSIRWRNAFIYYCLCKILYYTYCESGSYTSGRLGAAHV